MAFDLDSVSRQVLQPLSGESRVGPDLRDTPRQTTYSRLSARIDSDRRYQDSAGFDGEAADWQAVVRDAIQVLSKESKDLEVATWLARGLYRTAGPNGLGAGVMLLIQLQEQFWDDLHPKDRDVRRGRLNWLEDKLVADLRADALPHALSADATALRQHRQQCLALMPMLKAWPPAMSARYGREVPDLSSVMHALNMLAGAAGDKLAAMNEDLDIAEPTAPAVEPAGAVQSAGEFAAGLPRQATHEGAHADRAPQPSLPSAAASPSKPRTRKEALRQLDGLAAFFVEAEPLSPVGPALHRVARWARGSLREWLAEMVDNEAVLTGIFKTLDMTQDERK